MGLDMKKLDKQFDNILNSFDGEKLQNWIDKQENIVFEYNFGNDTWGKIVKEKNLFQCYETPLFGGEFIKSNEPFEELEKAINYLKSLT